MFANDISHVLLGVSIIDVFFFLGNAFNLMSEWWTKLIWYVNIGSFILMIWNGLFSSTSPLDISSFFYSAVVIACIVGFIWYALDLAIGALVVATFVVSLIGFFFGGRDYGVAWMNDEIHLDLSDYAYVGIIIGILILFILIYLRWIRGNELLLVIANGLVVTYVTSLGIDVIIKEDITCGFCTTEISVFNFDLPYFLILIVLGISYGIIYYTYGRKKKEKKKEQTKETEKESETEKEQEPHKPTVSLSLSKWFHFKQHKYEKVAHQEEEEEVEL